MTEEAEHFELDVDFVEEIMLKYYDLFVACLKSKKFMRDDDTFTNNDMAYVMYHMFEAFEQFDEKMDMFWNSDSIGENVDGMTPQ